MDSKSLRKELKKPDEFISLVSRVVQSIVDRMRGILIALATLLLFSVALLGWHAWKEARNDRAANAFEKIFEKPPSDAEGWKIAIPELESFLKTHGRTSVARVARLYYAEALLKTGKFAEARGAFVEAAEIQKGRNLFLAEEGEAMALMELKKFGEAEVIFMRLSKEADNPLRPLHLWNAGLAQESGEKKAQALATYQEFEKTFPESSLLERVRSRISALKVTSTKP